MLKLENDIGILFGQSQEVTIVINTFDKLDTTKFIKIVNEYIEINISKCKKDKNKTAVYCKVKKDFWKTVCNLYHLYSQIGGRKEIVNIIKYLKTEG